MVGWANRLLSALQRVESQITVDPVTECWVWGGGKLKDGYGVTRYSGKKWLVHRLIYHWFKERLLAGLEIDHLCRNRACCNPDHLEQVTHQENVCRGDYSRNGYFWSLKTHCPNGHEYTPENTKVVAGSRNCLTCMRARNRAYYRKRRELVTSSRTAAKNEE